MNRLLPAVLLFCWCAQAQIRVASLNIAKKHGAAEVAKIAGQPDLRRADVLLLQEVVDGPQYHVASAVAAAIGFREYFAPAFQLNSRFMEGLAVLSRCPIRAPEVIRLPRSDLHFHTRGRIALAVTLACPAGPLRVINTQLDDRINNDEKLRQIAELWKGTAGFNGPSLIGGDFNTGNFLWLTHLIPVPGLENERAMLNHTMTDHGFHTPFGAGPATFHLFGLKLDWIYLRGATAVESGVTPIPFSDHNSVWVRIRVP